MPQLGTQLLTHPVLLPAPFPLSCCFLQALTSHQAEAARMLLDAAADPMVLCKGQVRVDVAEAAAVASATAVLNSRTNEAGGDSLAQPALIKGVAKSSSSSSSGPQYEPYWTTALHLLLGDRKELLLGPVPGDLYQQLLDQAVKLAVHLKRIERLGGIRWEGKGRSGQEAAVQEAAAAEGQGAEEQQQQQQDTAAKQKERLVPAYEVLENSVNDIGALSCSGSAWGASRALLLTAAGMRHSCHPCVSVLAPMLLLARLQQISFRALARSPP
jgi:hypothetical protein